MEFDADQVAILQRQSRWIGRIQGICFCLAVLIAGMWIIQWTTV